jgi:hypothetical protein
MLADYSLKPVVPSLGHVVGSVHIINGGFILIPNLRRITRQDCFGQKMQLLGKFFLGN